MLPTYMTLSSYLHTGLGNETFSKPDALGMEVNMGSNDEIWWNTPSVCVIEKHEASDIEVLQDNSGTASQGESIVVLKFK
ncbi:hypothetical protein KCU89_g77, partial [Aureobasidium melanogenum]